MILGVIGSVVSGIAAFMQARSQAAIAEANAKQAELNAEHARDVAGESAMDIGMQNRGLLGELEAGQGASGVAIGSPSFGRSRGRLRQVSYQEQIRTVEAGEREAANFKTQANVFRTEARANRQAGAFGLISGVINGASSFASASTPTMRSPGYQPVSTVRNRYYVPGSVGLA